MRRQYRLSFKKRWAGVSIFVVSVVLVITRPVNIYDEGWFLQVIDRVVSGESLYRDVFFGATPLSVYVASGMNRILGVDTEMGFVRLLGACYFATIVGWSCRILRQLTGVQGYPWIFVAALLVYASRGLSSPGYTTLAYLFFLVCWSFLLSWQRGVDASTSTKDGRGFPLLAAAGGSAGLSFVSKQTTGLYTLMAGLVFIVWQTRRPAWKPMRAAVIFGGAYVCTAIPVFLWVGRSGSLEALWDYGFWSKGTYLRLGRVDYRKGLIYAMGLGPGEGWLERLGQMYAYAVFWLPLLTFLTLAWIGLRRKAEGRRNVGKVLPFVVASFATAFPRADYPHVASTAPALLIGLVDGGRFVQRWLGHRRMVQIRFLITLWLTIGLLFMLAKPGIMLALGRYRLSSLPHFRGIPMHVADLAKAHRYRSVPDEIPASSSLFFLGSEAGFFYLVTGIKNPTPFDNPLATAFGLQGEQTVIAAIARGQIHYVCLNRHDVHPELMPHRLVDFVQTSMEPVRDMGECVLYRSRLHKRDKPRTEESHVPPARVR